jgi:hypothetical protein
MKRVFIPLLFLFGHIVTGQDDEPPIDQIAEYYKNFEYQKVINASDSVISGHESLTPAVLIKLYLFKALSHYILNEEIAAQISFISILDLKPDFILDPVENSPKIVHFFNQVKEEYNKQQQQLTEIGEKSTLVDSSFITVKEISVIPRSALLRSAILPGWGHLYLREKSKGIIFSSLSISAALTAIYYSIRTHNKREDYLNEINKTKIEDRYQTYNKAYKLRNAFIYTYLAIWLYSQFDLLMFESLQTDEKSLSITLLPTSHYHDHLILNLVLRF